MDYKMDSNTQFTCFSVRDMTKSLKALNAISGTPAPTARATKVDITAIDVNDQTCVPQKQNIYDTFHTTAVP